MSVIHAAEVATEAVLNQWSQLGARVGECRKDPLGLVVTLGLDPDWPVNEPDVRDSRRRCGRSRRTTSALAAADFLLSAASSAPPRPLFG